MSDSTATAVPPKTTTRLRKRKLRWIVWLAVLVAASLGGLRVLAGRRQAPVAVVTVKAERGKVRDFVTSVAAGRVAAKQEATLRAEIAGKVLKLHVRRGGEVPVGAPLLTYDSAELRDRVRVAQAAVGLAQAQVTQAEQSAANVETNLARARRLQASNAIAAAEVENLEGQQKAAAKAIDAARAGVSQAAASVELARTALGRAVVVAPFSGTILTTTVEAGEVTAPGAPLVQIADVSELRVDAEIDEADLGRIKVGMPADVTFDAFPNERLPGTLREIAPSVTRDLKGGRAIAVQVVLAPDARLRVGMSADVDIIVSVRENALFVPPSAVQGRGAERIVYLVDGGVARKRVIDVGISTWEAVEVKGGLSEGDQVVASLSAAAVQDGTRVEPKER